MALFENLGKKASEATAKAMQKAQELSETARLKTLISDEEKKINSLYYQVGKLYVSLHGDEPEEAFSGMMGAIRNAEANVASLQKQIQDVKGVILCESCGAENPKGMAFCGSCGAPVRQAVEPSASGSGMKCERCGAAIEEGMRFCIACGNPLEQPAPPTSQETPAEQATEILPVEEIPETAPEPEAPPEIPMQSPALEPQIRLCPHCGASLVEGQLFCVECGGKV